MKAKSGQGFLREAQSDRETERLSWTDGERKQEGSSEPVCSLLVCSCSSLSINNSSAKGSSGKSASGAHNRHNGERGTQQRIDSHLPLVPVNQGLRRQEVHLQHDFRPGLHQWGHNKHEPAARGTFSSDLNFRSTGPHFASALPKAKPLFRFILTSRKHPRD